MNRRILLVALAGVVAVAALFAIEDAGGQVLDRLLLYLPGVDKLLHLAQSCLIFVAARFVARRLGSRERTATIAAVGVAGAVAMLDEVQQQFVPDRSVEIADIVASASGIALGVGATLRRQWRLAGSGLVALGLIAGLGITVRSYLETRDYKHGLRLESAGRYREAGDAYRRALAAGMSTPGLYNGLAWVEIESGVGDAPAAVRWAEQGLALAPRDPDLLDTYGWALYHAGRVEEAYASLLQAQALNPRIYCIHYHLGLALLKLGRVDEAVEHLRAQLVAAPDSREARQARDLLEHDPAIHAARR